MSKIKCVLVGDGLIGKDKLLFTYAIGIYPDEYYQPIFDYGKCVMFEDQYINLQLWDTAGQEKYKKLRSLLYPQTDVFIVAFSLVSPTSLENVENMWIPEITEHCPGTPYILVGLKSSLRDEFHLHEDEYRSKGWKPVSTAMGEEMKRKICAVDYVECDAKKYFHIKEVFESAIKCVIHPPQNFENLIERNRRLEQERLDQIKAEKLRMKAEKKAEKARKKAEIKEEKARKKADKEAEKLRIREQKQEEKNRKKSIEERNVKDETMDETKKDKKKYHINIHCSCSISFD